MPALGRHVDRAMPGAALGRGDDGHLNSPAGEFGKQDQRWTGGVRIRVWNPRKPRCVGQERARLPTKHGHDPGVQGRRGKAQRRSCTQSAPRPARTWGSILYEVVVRELHRLPVGQELDVNLPDADRRASSPRG